MKIKSTYFDLSTDFFNNGFIKIPNLLTLDEVAYFDEGCSLVRSKPTPFRILLNDSDNNEFFMDYNNWRRFRKIYDMCAYKKILGTIKKLTKSKNCWLLHDDVIIKRGNNSPLTPIHHDRPYFIFKGNKNLSVWIALTHIPRESSLIMWKGSHKLGKLFLPNNFSTGKTAQEYIGLDRDIFKDLSEVNLNSFEKVDFQMDPGDVIIFFHKTLHAAKTHKTKGVRKSFVIRYLLDGARLTKKYYNNVPPYEKQGVKIIEDGKVPENFFPRLGF